MHRAVLVVLGIIFWGIGLFVPLQPISSAAYIPTNILFPLVGTILFVPAIAKADKGR